MSVLLWHDEYNSGVASIDHEHRQMIETLNDLFSQIGEGCGVDMVERYLGDIHALIESHFALEEREMRDNLYVNYAAHKADHDRLLDDIRDIMDSVSLTKGGDIRSDLEGVLRQWFEQHFTTLDKDLHTLTHK